MTSVFSTLYTFLSEAWTGLVGTLVILGLIALLAQTLRAASSAVIGARFGLANAVAAFAGLAFILIFALTCVPVLSNAVDVTVAACGPLAELGTAVAAVIAGLASIRMGLACLRAVSTGIIGGGEGVATALTEAGEAFAGMLLAVLVGPIAGHFFGVC